MKFLIAAVLLCLVPPAEALTPAAREFIEISKKLEPVHCEKRQLRRTIALAKVEGRMEDGRKAERRFAQLDRNPETSKLEKRLAQLEPQIQQSKDPEDLRALSLQQREAFYRCE